MIAVPVVFPVRSCFPIKFKSGINVSKEMVGKMEAVVEMDAKGRIVIPSKLRKEFASRRMVMKAEKDHFELIPLPDPKSLKGKYKIEGKIEDIEELQERTILKRV
jgi:DNA-binding transcriptional regulator/RsmH inhibitor MraZ